MTECIARPFCQLVQEPVIFDPVGVGATSFRRTTAMVFLFLFCPFVFALTCFITWTRAADTWQASVIKGNAGELAALANSTEVGLS